MLSVCIATYNGEKYIKEQLESILIQLSDNDEVIVSDDGSTDSTIEIIKSFKDKRIRILADNNFRSPIYNMENALKEVKGDVVFLSDQDDIWLNNKVEESLKYLKNADLIFSDAIVVDEDLNEIRNSFNNGRIKLTGLMKNLVKNNYVGATMAFNNKVLKRVLPFPKNIPMHDQWIGVIAEYYYSVKYIDKPLILYRRHSSNASFTGGSSGYSLKKKISFRISIVRLFLKYIITSAIYKNI